MPIGTIQRAKVSNLNCGRTAWLYPPYLAIARWTFQSRLHGSHEKMTSAIKRHEERGVRGGESIVGRSAISDALLDLARIGIRHENHACSWIERDSSCGTVAGKRFGGVRRLGQTIDVAIVPVKIEVVRHVEG